VAVDGNLEKVIQELAPKVKTTRLQMLSTAPTTDVSYSFANYRRDGYDYWQQLSDGRIVFGGCRDFYSKFEWQAANEPDEKVQSKLEEFLRTHIGT
jgi:glycine/D-amino acid oxidase-like deaminating enzyme